MCIRDRADDYMSKPFSILELMARVRARLRVANLNISASGGFRIDRNTYKVFYLFSFYYLMMDYEPSRAVLYTILAFFNLGFIPLLLCRHNVPVGVAGRCEPLQPKYNIH